MKVTIRKHPNSDLYHVYHNGFRSEKPMKKHIAEKHKKRIMGGMISDDNERHSLISAMNEINMLLNDGKDISRHMASFAREFKNYQERHSNEEISQITSHPLFELMTILTEEPLILPPRAPARATMPVEPVKEPPRAPARPAIPVEPEKEPEKEHVKAPIQQTTTDNTQSIRTLQYQAFKIATMFENGEDVRESVKIFMINFNKCKDTFSPQDMSHIIDFPAFQIVNIILESDPEIFTEIDSMTESEKASVSNRETINTLLDQIHKVALMNADISMVPSLKIVNSNIEACSKILSRDEMNQITSHPYYHMLFNKVQSNPSILRAIRGEPEPEIPQKQEEPPKQAKPLTLKKEGLLYKQILDDVYEITKVDHSEHIHRNRHLVKPIVRKLNQLIDDLDVEVIKAIVTNDKFKIIQCMVFDKLRPEDKKLCIGIRDDAGISTRIPDLVSLGIVSPDINTPIAVNEEDIEGTLGILHRKAILIYYKLQRGEDVSVTVKNFVKDSKDYFNTNPNRGEVKFLFNKMSSPVRDLIMEKYTLPIQGRINEICDNDDIIQFEPTQKLALPFVSPFAKRGNRYHIIVDYSNIYISIRNAKRRMNIEGLIDKLQKGKHTISKSMASSRKNITPEEEQIFRNHGYNVEIENSNKKEVYVDKALQEMLGGLMYETHNETLIFASGDGNSENIFNFPELIKQLLALGWKVEIWAVINSLSTAYKIIARSNPNTLAIVPIIPTEITYETPR